MPKMVELPTGQIAEFPDEMGDDEILSVLREKFPPTQDPYANDSAWDFSGERNIFGAGLAAAKAPARGFANTILGSVEGTAELLDAATNFVGLDSLIDSGDENAAVWAANAGKDWINKESGAKIDPRYQDLWSTKFGEGVGSFVSFLTPSLLLKGASWLNRGRLAVQGAETIGKLSRAEKVATGAFAAATGAGEAAQRAKGAREEGLDVTEGQEDFATAQGALVGLTEMLPISRIFGRVPKNIPIGEKDYLLNMFKSAGLAAAEEGTQEVGAAILQNMIERGYNPNQEIIEGSLMDDLTIGAGVGALADIALNAFAGRRKGYMSAAQIENERKAREIESRNHFQYQQEVAERSRLNELIRTDPQAFAAESEKVQALASTIPAPSNEEVAAFNQPSMAGPVVTPASVGELYALRIVGGLGSFFPTNTSFKVERGEDIAAPVVAPDGTETTVPQPTFKVVDSTGKQYGQTMTNPDIASSLANNLNGEIVGQSIRGSILNTLMTSPKAYDPEQTSGLFRYGYQALNPESNTVTYAAMNDAAGTTTENGYIEEVSYKDILKSPRVLVKAGKNKNLKSVNDLKLAYEVTMPDGKKRMAVGLTAAQELNRKREEAGLPEVNTFNIREARNALGGNIGSISNPSVSGINDQLKYSPVMLNGKPAVISQANEVLTQRKTTFKEKADAGFKQDGTSVLPDYIEFQSEADARRYANTLNNRKADKRYVPEELFAGKTDLYKELNQLLKSKNIDATLESPEIEQLVKSFTGARDAKSMSLEDQKLFYARLRNLPGFSTQTKLPVFRVRPYAPEQFVAATQYQNQNPGAVTDEGLAQAVGLSPTDPKIAAIKADLQRQTDFRLQKEAADTANMPLVQGLQKALDSFGLSGINLRLSQTLTEPGAADQNEGYFDAQMNELALAIDAIVGENLTDEQRLNQLKSVLSHESVHAAKFLDLWTAKEWDILSQAAQRTLRPEGMDGAGTTFLAYAQRMYPDMSPDIQVEESIAELARAFIDNRKLIGGKPRNLIERLIRFFQRMASFVNASGYPSFESILDDFRTGKIGARERGVVRTLRLTNNVPEGYVVAEDVPEGVETRTISDFDEAALEGADIRESRKPIVNVEERNKAFENLAQSQRGAPEIAMVKAQDALHNLKDPAKAGQKYQDYESQAVYSYLLEHVGDLTHRMSEYPNSQPSMGLENVVPKVRRSLDALSNRIDLENMSKIPLIPELEDYAVKHSRLKVFNEMQKAAREAAVALGLKNFSFARANLQMIQDAIDDGSYGRISMEYNPDIRYSRKTLPDTIEVDGVQRPTANSEGLPIFEGNEYFTAEEGLRNFWRWFGNSKAVDDQGRPIVFYHGTSAEDFDEFDVPAYFSENADEASAYSFAHRLDKREKMFRRMKKWSEVKGDGPVTNERVHYVGIIADIAPSYLGKPVATDEGVVVKKENGYVDYLSDWVVDYDFENNTSYDPVNRTIRIKKGDGSKFFKEKISNYKDFIESETNEKEGVRGRVYPVYLSIQNPKDVSPLEGNILGKRLGFNEEKTKKFISELKDGNFDGVSTFSDTVSVFPDLFDHAPPRHFIALSKNQIKSSIGNTGAFSEKDDSIRFSRRGVPKDIDVDVIRQMAAAKKRLPKTIDVDGVQRPTMNSLKNPIHTTEDGIRNFWRWFGNSGVVDKRGRPIPVYHGTRSDFSEFGNDYRELGFHFGIDVGQSQFRLQHPDSLKYALVTPNMVMQQLGIPADQRRQAWASLNEKQREYMTELARISGDKYLDNANIMPLYLRIENPVVLKGDAGNWHALTNLRRTFVSNAKIFTNGEFDAFKDADDVRKALQDKGYDGVFYINQYEEFEGIKPQAFIAFERNQAKSVTGNTGAFSNDNPDVRYSRKATRSPIEDAIALANEKHADFKTRSEKEFFTHWQKLLKTVGNQLAPTPGSIRIAAKKAINDMDAWLKDNPRYADYYENDMQAVKEVLEGRFGAVSDEEMSLFQALNGLTSPNTKLKSNVADALNLFSLYREDGNFDDISLGWSEKGNNVLMYSPVRISGTSAGNKARAVKIIDQIIKEQGSIEKAMKFLHGSVTMPQLHAFKRSLGYKSNVSGVGPIKALVKNATGQDTMIPRMFIFGKKVGAYTLNLTGNHKYTTIDIWESRFIRSYFNGLFQKNTGLPVDAFEHDLFSRFNELFKEEFDKLTGKDWEPSALQAMRWFYILNAANKAGYKGASTNDTISEYARKQIQSAGVRSGQGRRLGDESTRNYSRKPNRFYSESLVAFVRPNRASNGTASIPYARGSGRDGATVRILNNDVAVAKSYIPSQEFKNIVTGLEQEAKPFYELAPDLKSAETFRDAISLFKSLPENKYRASVSVYSAEEYADMRLFLTESGKTGFALKNDGDIVSVFSYERGGRSAMELAIQSGGRKLDCFDTVLPDFYASHLFSEAGRVKWDDSQAPEGWDKEVFKKFNNGEPDVVMMVYDPVGTMLTTEAPQMGYDEALDAQSQMQAELSPPADDGAMPTSFDQTPSNATQAQLDDAVAKAAKDTERTPATSIPLYGPNASPEALYVAQNPQMGAKLGVDEKKRYSRRGNEPQYPPHIQKLIDQTPAPADETMGQTLVKNLQMGSLKDAIDNMRQAFIFRGARLERQYKENPELARMMADTSALAAMEMADHARSLTQAAITGGIPVYENGGFKVVPFVYKGKTIERGLLEIMAPLHSKEHGNLERLAHRYAMAVRGERLNNEGKLTPIAPGELQALEAEIQKYRNPATGQPVVKEWYDMWQAYNANIVQYLQKTGIIDDAGAQLWMKQADYIPFYRENADGTLMHPKVFGGLHTAGQFKAVGKSSADLNVDMVTAIVNNIDAAIAMGIKNVAQQRIIRDQMNLGLASVLKQGETVGDRHSVSFKINGKRYTAIIEDPLIYQSMLPASEIPMDGLFGTMFRIPANVLRELIIRDPGYMMANMFRDTLSTYVTTGAEVIPLWGTAKGFTGDIEKLRNLGVIGGYDLRMDKNGVRDFYDKEAKKMGMVAGINWLNPVTAAWEVMGRISERSEAATRLAVYEDVLKRTGNEVEAQYQALSVMNYGRRGNNALLRMTTAMVPFLNARIQGLDKLYQAATGRESAIYKKDAAGKVVPEIQRRKNFARFVFRAGLIMSVTAMYYAMVSDDDEYENASPEVRDNYYILPVIKGDTETGEPGLSVRLPIPFEVGILFKVIPERLIASIYGDDTSKDFKDSMKRALFSTLAINPTPQAVLPIGEAMLNKDTYTGRPIIPYYMEHLLPEQQKTFYTNKFAEQVANSLGASPMKVEHVMQGYGGTLGGYFLQAVDSAMRSGGDQKPAMAWHQYPFIKRFFTTANQPGLQNKFYELKNDVDGITQTINKLTEEGRYDELAAFYAKNGHMYEMRKDLNYLEKQITALREQRKMIEQMDISPEAKREQVEQINMMISAMLLSVPMYRKAAYEPE